MTKDYTAIKNKLKPRWEKTLRLMLLIERPSTFTRIFGGSYVEKQKEILDNFLSRKEEGYNGSNEQLLNNINDLFNLEK